MFSSQNSQVSNDANYIEDVFSTYLYTGTGNTNAQTITNGIDLSGKGGLVWLKSRSNTYSHYLTDTVRGAGNQISSNTTDANTATGSYGISFGSTGFNIGTSGTGSNNGANFTGATFASWTFRKQPKFFDVVTWTGDGSGNINIPHNLGSVPGCIMMKKTSAALDWYVYHRDLNYPNSGSPQNNTLKLNTTDAGLNSTAWQSGPTSTYFPVLGSAFNVSGATYVAYLFAHNAGGFGLTGTDNVISCGSFTTDGSAVGTANLGYEPQLILLKKSSGAQNWFVFDNMRGMTALQSATFSNAYGLNPNLSDAEVNYGAVNITSTGFATTSGALDASSTYIYIAIRRGPMKVPTSGTSVFAPVSQASHGTVTTNFPVDLTISTLNALGDNRLVIDRLRGSIKGSSYVPILETNATVAEQNFGSGATYYFGYDNNTGYVDTLYNTGFNIIYWNFKRAPSFFDEVCYTGTGSGTTFAHNLGVVPEMMIVKCRSQVGTGWPVYQTLFTGGGYAFLDTTSAAVLSGNTSIWNGTAPTASVFSVGTNSRTNTLGATYVAYLFATCAGVSKVGSYTGNGSTQTINCGFTSGARFVLIKRTDSTGDWYVYDTARGMTTLTDPYLLLNSTAAESSTLGSVTTVSTGFAVNASILAAINTNGASYIYLSIA